jgi:spore maturation protein CgeB
MTEPRQIDELVPNPQDQAAIHAASDLPVVSARSGVPTVEYGGTRHHSRIDPLAEATAIIAEHEQRITELATTGAVRVILLGPGLGYLVKALDILAASRCPQQRVEAVCIESDPLIARCALRHRVWAPSRIAARWMLAGNIKARSTFIDERTVIVRATPGYRSAKSVYETALKPATQPEPTGPLRILVPTPLYGGSLPIARYCADALKRCGHHVELLDLSPHYEHHQQLEALTGSLAHQRALQGLHATLLGGMIVARAIDARVDLVWAVAQTPLMPTALDELRHANIRSAFWFVEDYRLFPYWQSVAAHYDAVFSIQRGAFHAKLEQAGSRHCSYLPLAADPGVHRPLELSPELRSRFGSATSFVGAPYANRRATFADLPLPGLKIWGNNWPDSAPFPALVQEGGRRLHPAECVTVFNATDVNINLHSSAAVQGVDPAGDFVNPRTFEIAASGAFQLVDRRAELADLFDIGTEQIVFDDVAELPRLVTYYGAHPDERRQIAAAARARVLREHTYEQRMQTALAQLADWFPELKRQPPTNYLDDLMRAADGDAELTEFLSHFERDRALTLDDIVARIQTGAGRLSRPEAMFLLMKEFRDWGVERGVIA